MVAFACAFLVKDKTTCSKNERLLLICVASLINPPVDPVFSILSEPARSTRCNLLSATSFPAVPVLSFLLLVI